MWLSLMASASLCVFLQVCVYVSLLLWLCMGLRRFSSLQRVVCLSGQEIKFFSRCGCPVRVGLWVIENPDGYAWASRKKMLLQKRKSKRMFWNGPGAHLCLCTPLRSLCSVPFSPLIFPSLHILRLSPSIPSLCHRQSRNKENIRARGPINNIHSPNTHTQLT